MTQNLLQYSMFQKVLFPSEEKDFADTNNTIVLRREKRLSIAPGFKVLSKPIIVFDLETTGLDSHRDKIIEIGAIKYFDFEEVEVFSKLINPQMNISKEIEALTGISDSMVASEPTIETVLPEFLKFIDGCILFAHNAEFDLSFIKNACNALSIDLNWPALCTLKMARQFLPQLESKNLDSLAKHFNLNFESRHRSIGDIRVTQAVLRNFSQLHVERLSTWQRCEDFAVA
ncbi:MAG: 3'-5' exonuclease [Oligoflexales bacterium]|nr:3'-5' exonuclease [Oligoflexales bacterium]